MTVPNVALPAPGKPITGGMIKDKLQAALLHPSAAGERKGGQSWISGSDQVT